MTRKRKIVIYCILIVGIVSVYLFNNRWKLSTDTVIQQFCEGQDVTACNTLEAISLDSKHDLVIVDSPKKFYPLLIDRMGPLRRESMDEEVTYLNSYNMKRYYPANWTAKAHTLELTINDDISDTAIPLQTPRYLVVHVPGASSIKLKHYNPLVVESDETVGMLENLGDMKKIGDSYFVFTMKPYIRSTIMAYVMDDDLNLMMIKDIDSVSIYSLPENIVEAWDYQRNTHYTLKNDEPIEFNQDLLGVDAKGVQPIESIDLMNPLLRLHSKEKHKISGDAFYERNVEFTIYNYQEDVYIWTSYNLEDLQNENTSKLTNFGFISKDNYEQLRDSFESMSADSLN